MNEIPFEPSPRRRIKPKMIVDPEWTNSEEGQRHARIERMRIEEQCVMNRDCFEDYYPEEYDKLLPEEGSWIMLLMTVQVAKSTGETNDNNVEHIDVPHLSMWFALPSAANVAKYESRYPRQAIIQTPQGEVRIWPHEYSIVRDITRYLSATEEEGVYLKFMNESAAFDEERLFYIMQRGISRGDAQRILLPEIRDPFFCYILFHEAYSDALGEGFGSGRLVAANHERRRAARAAKERVQ